MMSLVYYEMNDHTVYQGGLWIYPEISSLSVQYDYYVYIFEKNNPKKASMHLKSYNKTFSYYREN